MSLIGQPTELWGWGSPLSRVLLFLSNSTNFPSTWRNKCTVLLLMGVWNELSSHISRVSQAWPINRCSCTKPTFSISDVVEKRLMFSQVVMLWSFGEHLPFPSPNFVVKSNTTATLGRLYNLHCLFMQKLHAHNSYTNHCIIPGYMGMFLNIHFRKICSLENVFSLMLQWHTFRLGTYRLDSLCKLLNGRLHSKGPGVCHKC